MHSFYAQDDVVRRIQNGGCALSRAQHVYTEQEAAEPFFAVVKEISWIIGALQSTLSIRGSINFAVVMSLAPYQVVYLGDESFVVLIDQRAFYMLLTLCTRTQSLSPLAQELGFSPIDCDKDYRGSFLLDIVKSFTFHTNDVSPYIGANVSALIYQAANTYIVGHEIAHISHGHLDFKASSDFQDFCKDENDRNLTLRTLEMDADSSATTSVLDVFEQHINYVIASRNFPSHITTEALRLSMRKQYVTGMLIALLYMDALSSNFAPVAHPISYARFLTTTMVTKSVLSRVDAEAASIPDLMRQHIVSAFAKLSGDISTLGYPIASNVMMIDGDVNKPQYLYNEIGVAAGLAQLEPLHRRWARIRPLLEKYLRGGRLAPAQAIPF
jgi:hypothetical protein